MRFPRTIRLDASDVQVFPAAAAPGEWAVPGSFAFAGMDPAVLSGKQRQAFTSGFLGLMSFGWSTLVIVSDIAADELNILQERLTTALLERYGAPDRAAAEAATAAETAFAADLCEHKLNTLIALQRSLGPEGIVESFRLIDAPRGAMHARIWEIVAGPHDD